jgi:hypothetical protein
MKRLNFLADEIQKPGLWPFRISIILNSYNGLLQVDLLTSDQAAQIAEQWL